MDDLPNEGHVGSWEDQAWTNEEDQDLTRIDQINDDVDNWTNDDYVWTDEENHKLVWSNQENQTQKGGPEVNQEDLVKAIRTWALVGDED